MEIATFNKVMSEALAAGYRALEECQPKPMVVAGGGQSYYVSEGLCGFAWVEVYGVRGNTKLGKHMKTVGFDKSYGTSALQYWISHGGQSVARKEAFAEAMASVLENAGLRAYATSRLD